MKKLMLPLAAAIALSGCYHVTVDTGWAPSGQVVEEKWAHSFLGGLVPPETVETASRCPSGVARVESKLSFLNLVAGAITGGLYTPMTIEVACAGGGAGDAGTSALLIRRDRGTEHAQEVLAQAAARSLEAGNAVWIRFE